MTNKNQDAFEQAAQASLDRLMRGDARPLEAMMARAQAGLLPVVLAPAKKKGSK